MALYTCRKCGKKVPMQYEICPFCRTPRPAIEANQDVPSKNAKKKEGKKHPVLAAIAVIMVVLAIGSVIGGGDKEDDRQKGSSSSDTSSIQSSQSVPVSDLSEPDGPHKTGSYTLPCGMDLLFYDSVRNDVTGKWRYSATSSSEVPADHALEYYNEMFSSDDEIHGVWNATLGTMTCIKSMSGLLFVDTYEYVDGEEHDAKLMFSGMLLDSRIIDITTGEPFDDT